MQMQQIARFPTGRNKAKHGDANEFGRKDKVTCNRMENGACAIINKISDIDNPILSPYIGFNNSSGLRSANSAPAVSKKANQVIGAGILWRALEKAKAQRVKAKLIFLITSIA